MIAGAIGGGGRLEYTVIGDAVNIAQRLQSEAAGGEIVAAASTVAAAPVDRVEPIGAAAGEGSRGAGRGLSDPRRGLMTISDGGLRRLAWSIFGLMVLGGVVSISLDQASGYQIDVGFAVDPPGVPGRGHHRAAKRPRTTLAWLMLGMGFVVTLPFQDYAEYALAKGLPGAGVGLALSEPTWVPFIGISGFLLLLFPDGHLPSPRWRWFAWICAVGLVVLSLAVLFGPGTFGDIGHPESRTPWGSMHSMRSAAGSTS